jgi:Fic family protein
MYVASAPESANYIGDIDRFQHALEVLSDQSAASAEYLHWDKLRHLDPPADLTHEEWWRAIKWTRRSQRRTLPLADAGGQPFTYSTPDSVLRLLHYVDQRCAGEIAMQEVVTADDQARAHYLVNSLMEEAIRSSQLEGAATSRRVAKELLRSDREPKDRSERMIVNNYRALQFMREEIGETLTPEAVLELHRIVTDGTLDDPDGAGRLQRPEDERIAVIDRTDGDRVLHSPPPADQLPDRLAALCDFANESHDAEQFLHPVVRGVLLHFWLAHDHPFEDGNGRTARALFYWFMRQKGYWLVEYLSISRILRDAPSQYARAFLLTESDDRDTTYFLLHHLQVVRRAVEELHSYLERKTAEIREVERLLTRSGTFNHRQLAVLSDALRNPSQTYSLRVHAASHGVTHETARTDLSRLVSLGVLERRRPGRQYEYVPVADLTGQLERL